MRETYNKVITDADVADAPRDYRVVRNVKYAATSNTKRQRAQQTGHTFADEVQAVMNMALNDDFVRAVVVNRNRVSSVILHTEQQVRDIKSCFDRNHGSVLGFYKTYNLGAIYVTPSVFKNPVLQSKIGQDSPLFIGPTFLHGHSHTKTYSQFFGHLSGHLMACDFGALTMGSDNELAMRKAMQHFFARTRSVVCSRHIRENQSHTKVR